MLGGLTEKLCKAKKEKKSTARGRKSCMMYADLRQSATLSVMVLDWHFGVAYKPPRITSNFNRGQA